MSTARPRSAASADQQQVADLLQRLLSHSRAPVSDILGEAGHVGVNLVEHTQPILDGISERRRRHYGRGDFADQFSALTSSAHAMSQVDHDRFAEFVVGGLSGPPSKCCEQVRDLVEKSYPLRDHLPVLAPIFVDLFRRSQDEDRRSLMRSVVAITNQPGDAAEARQICASFTASVLRSFAGHHDRSTSVSLSLRSTYAQSCCDTALALLTPDLQTRYATMTNRLAGIVVACEQTENMGQRFVNGLSTVQKNGCSLKPFAAAWSVQTTNDHNQLNRIEGIKHESMSQQRFARQWRPADLPLAYVDDPDTVASAAYLAQSAQWSMATRLGWGNPHRAAAGVLWLEQVAEQPLVATSRGGARMADMMTDARVTVARTVALGLRSPSAESGLLPSAFTRLSSCANRLQMEEAHLIIRLAVLGDRLRQDPIPAVAQSGDALLAAIGGQADDA